VTLNLVVLAAGMGSRFGGVKQVAAVDDRGHALVDYAVFDAVRAGFERVVVVTTAALEADFHALVGRRIALHADLAYTHQALSALPAGFGVPEGRVKPWGTAHAVLCAAPAITGPFATINADDFYGPAGFRAAAAFLADHAAPDRHALIAYELAKTLSEHGTVSRGVCAVEDGRLAAITELTSIGRARDGRITAATEAGERVLAADTPVSLNLWAFHPAVLAEFGERFPLFLETAVPANPLKAEFFLPSVPDALIREGRAAFDVLTTPDRWYGVTYADDLPEVRAALAGLRRDGVYPADLWGRA
jgi:hypothetical protein